MILSNFGMCIYIYQYKKNIYIHIYTISYPKNHGISSSWWKLEIPKKPCESTGSYTPPVWRVQGFFRDIYVHLCTENREKHGPTELSNPKSRVELPNVDWPPPRSMVSIGVGSRFGTRSLRAVVQDVSKQTCVGISYQRV